MRFASTLVVICCLLSGPGLVRSEVLERRTWSDAVTLHIAQDSLRAFALPGQAGALLNAPDLRARMDEQGLRFESVDGGKRWRLDLRLLDFGERRPGRPLIQVQGAQISAWHGAGLIHHLDNRPEGLEQSFIVEKNLGLDFEVRLSMQGARAAGIEKGSLALDMGGGVTLRASAPEAFDAEGRRLDARFVLHDEILSIRIRGALSYPVFIDPVWTSSGEERADARYGWSVAGVGDVNRDGFDDVVVSAPWFSTANTSAGKIYLYYGNASGLSATPSWTSSGDDNNRAYFGYQVAGAGDVNGDGYADIAVGTYGQGGHAEGKAFVYHGAFNGPLSTPAWSSIEGGVAQAFYGAAIAGAGDVNGDGYDDLIVGAPAEDPVGADPGHAFVYHGSASGLSGFAAWTAVGEDQAGAGFGFSVASAGDVNHDGFDDVIVGANLHDTTYQNAGRAFVYHGSATGLAATPVWAESGATQTNAGFGWDVAGAGDVNGDGYDEILIGSPGWGGVGRAYLYNGQAAGPATSYGWHYSGTNQAGARFGAAVSGAGDVDGDGYADLLVAAPMDSTAADIAGRAFLYHGSSFGPQTPPAWSSSGDDQEGAGFGYAIDAAGDLNQDGAADFIVGAYWAVTAGQVKAGRAYVYLGVKDQPGLCEPPGAACDDGDACTMNDACTDGGLCAGEAYSCDDGNICTEDQCLGDGTCSFPHATGACDDGDPCTVNDRCSNAVCAGEDLDCAWMDDQCSLGVCNSATGTCTAQPLPDGTACDDGDPCTGDEICTGGVCLHQTYTCAGPDDPGGGGGCASAGSPASGLPVGLLAWLLLIRRGRETN